MSVAVTLMSSFLLKFWGFLIPIVHFYREVLWFLTSVGKKEHFCFSLGLGICWFRCNTKMQVEHGKCFLEAKEEVSVIEWTNLLRKATVSHWLREPSSLSLFLLFKGSYWEFTLDSSCSTSACISRFFFFSYTPSSKAVYDNFIFLPDLWTLRLQDSRCWKMYFVSCISCISNMKSNMSQKKCAQDWL